MTTAQVLRKARALIRKGWTQGYHSRLKNGWPSDDNYSPKCRSFCAIGALDRASKGHPDKFRLAFNRLKEAADWHRGLLSEWNDSPRRTKAQVLAAFDRAIKAASK